MQIICSEVDWMARGRVLSLVSHMFGVNVDYEFKVRVLYAEFVVPREMLGCFVSVLHQGRWVCGGVVSACVVSGHGPFECQLQLVSPLGALRQRVSNRVFADLDIDAILRRLLMGVAFECFWVKAPAVVSHFQQVNESDAESCLRLLARYQLFFAWVHRNQGLQLLVSDSLEALAREIELLDVVSVWASGMVHGEGGVVIQQYDYCAAGMKVLACTESLHMVAGQWLQLEGKRLQLLSQQLLVQQDAHGGYNIKNELVLGKMLDKQVQHESFMLTQAKVQANNREPMLDEVGHYYLQYEFDTVPASLQHNSMAMPLVQFAGGQGDCGWHFPLSGGAKVLCAQLDDTEQAIILGALSDTDTMNVVTADNVTQHKVLSRQQQSLTLDDTKGSEQFILMNNPALYLQMRNTKELPGIAFVCKQGEMEIAVADTMCLQVGGNIAYRVAKGYELFVAGNVTETYQGGCTWFAGANIELQSQAGMQLATQGSLLMHSEQEIQWDIQKQLCCSAKGMGVWQTNEGSIRCYAQGPIEVDAQSLQLNHESCHLRVTESCIELNAMRLAINADNIKVIAHDTFYSSSLSD